MRAGRYLRVWFNQGLSNVYDALVLIRRADRPRQLTLLASHSLETSPIRIAAHEMWREPAGSLSEDEYVDWCLRVCAERKVHLFMPGRRRQAVARRRGEFELNGTKVLVPAGPDVLDLFEHKDRFYADLVGTSMPVPELRTVLTVSEFEEAYRTLSARHAQLCIKPAVSVFGAGFHVLEARDDEYRRFISSDGFRIGVDAVRRAIAEARPPRDLLVMEYLPGPERSIDCLAHEGRLIAAVARVKRQGCQEIETSGPAIGLAALLTNRYRLNGLFNVQTRDARGRPHLLEVNARMSGGILYACLSGVTFPYWAVLLALGLATPEEIPSPRGALTLAPVTAAVVVTRAATTADASRLTRTTQIGDQI